MKHLICQSWRDLPAERIAPLYEAEIDRWASTLDWETAANWEEVERGRRLGTAAGVVVTDGSGAIVAWSYYVVHRRALQIGGLVASTEASVHMMLDAILTDDTLSRVDTVTFFAYSDAPGVAPALRSRGLAVDRYWYLGRDAGRAAPPNVSDLRRWRLDDAPATAELLARAYSAGDEARPFAPRGSAEEWNEYLSQLTAGSGCGALLADACICVPGGPHRLLGVALVTRIGPNSGHLAQLAIDPIVQGQHLGTRLLEWACTAVAQAGCTRMTLFVGGRNSRARRLYEQARFEPAASFLAAGSLHPRRSTSVAPGGMVMTRR